MPALMATCPRDGAPLIATMAFRGAEFYCLDCGARLGFLAPTPAPASPELDERYAALKAEWDEHAGAKLLAAGAWLTDCAFCKVGGATHEQHATEAERRAHEAALVWLRERVTVGAPG